MWSTCCEQAFWLTIAESIRIQASQQVSGGLKELHAPRIWQLALSMFKALRTFTAALGAGETEALGAATASVLENARMKASNGIVCPHIFFYIRSESPWDLAAEAGLGLAQSWFWLNVDEWRPLARQDTCLYTLKANVYFHKNFGLRIDVTFLIAFVLLKHLDSPLQPTMWPLWARYIVCQAIVYQGDY